VDRYYLEMLSFLHKLREKLRHGTMAFSVLGRFSRLGIGINPYIIYREERPLLTECQSLVPSVERVTLENCERLLSDFASERKISPDGWKRELQKGKIALVMRLRDRSVGYTWANLSYYAPYHRQTELGPKQAYLTNTYIAKNFRRQGLGTLMKQAMYRELLHCGRTEFLSISDLMNTPAKNWKRRMNATPLELRLALHLFHRWHADVRLRAYADVARHDAASPGPRTLERGSEPAEAGKSYPNSDDF